MKRDLTQRVTGLVLVDKGPGLSPGQRFRLEQAAPILAAEHAIDLDFMAFESAQLSSVLYEPGRVWSKAALIALASVRRCEVVKVAGRYDVVIVYRHAALIGPPVLETILARTGHRLIYDFDDAIWLSDDGSVNRRFTWMKFHSKVATICRLSAAVIVGNSYLAMYARRYNSNVHVIPTMVNLDAFPVQPDLESDRPFRLVWSGTHSGLSQVEGISGALERAGRQVDLVLRVISNQPPRSRIPGVSVEFVQWSTADEARRLGSAHAGLMPLPDNPFTRGKGAFKALLYMAVGRPAVVSPVGFNLEVVRHGQNGLLAANEDEWVDAILTLANSRELRIRLGREGRSTVEHQFGAGIGAAHYARVIRDVIGSGRAGGHSGPTLAWRS